MGRAALGRQCFGPTGQPYQHDAEQDARDDAGDGIDGEGAGDSSVGKAEGIDVEHIRDWNAIGRSDEAEGCGGQRVVSADGFKRDCDARGDGQGLEEILRDQKYGV